MRRRAPAALGLLLVCGACFFAAPDEAIPDPSVCDNAPGEAVIAEAAIGTAPGAFVPLRDGDGTYLAEDGQGDQWLALRPAWRGEGAPACARVRVAIRDPADDSELDHRSEALTSSPWDGWRVGDELYFRAQGLPDEIVAVVEVYGVVARRTLRVGGYTPPEDAGR